MKKMKNVYICLAVFATGSVFAQPATNVGMGSGQPGNAVSISVDYLGTGSGVVGMQADINYDNTKISAVDISSCGGTLADATVSCADNGSRVRLFGASGSLTELPDGSLGTISFTIDGAVTPPDTIPLTLSGELYSNNMGSGVAANGSTDGQISVNAGPQPAWSSAPVGGSTLTFPTVIAGGANQTQMVAVTNAGAVGSTLTGTCALSGATDPELTITSGAAVSLSDGASSNVNLSCDATAAGTFTGSLDCTHNGDATGEPSPVSYPLSCTVSPPGQAIYSSTPADGATIAMTTGTGVLVGSTAPTATLDISNAAPLASDNDLELIGCAMAGGSTITAAPTPLNAMLAPNGGAGTTVTFTCPTGTVGSFSDTYNCTYAVDGASTPVVPDASYTVNCDVRAAASAGSPINGTMSTLNITAPPGGAQTGSFTFSETNNEGADVTNLSCAIDMGTSADFTITTAPSATIASGTSSDLVVTLTDGGNTPLTGSITCTYDDSVMVGNTVTINLSGSIRAVVVPTLSYIGYAAMILGLLFVGFVGFRRRA